MRIHEVQTGLAPEEVIERAREFFTFDRSPYAAFEEKSGSGYLKLFLEVGEIVIGANASGGVTVVRGSASRGDHLLASFLTTLASPHDPRQVLHRYGVREERGALSSSTAQGLLPPGA